MSVAAPLASESARCACASSRRVCTENQERTCVIIGRERWARRECLAGSRALPSRDRESCPDCPHDRRHGVLVRGHVLDEPLARASSNSTAARSPRSSARSARSERATTPTQTAPSATAASAASSKIASACSALAREQERDPRRSTERRAPGARRGQQGDCELRIGRASRSTPFRQRSARTVAAQASAGLPSGMSPLEAGRLDGLGPPLTRVGTPSQGMHPRAEDRDRRIALEQRRVVEHRKPALDGRDPPAPEVGKPARADEPRELVHVARSLQVVDRDLELTVRLAPVGRAAIERLARARARAGRARP